MGPTPKLVPPIYFLGTLVLMAVLHWLAPVAVLIPAPMNLLGLVFIVGGVAISAVAANLFGKKGTAVRPFAPSTVLVVEGLYRVTRNPMYLGLTIALIGAAVLFGTLTPLLLVPVFMGWIQHEFVRREERFLEGIFGQQYLDYKAACAAGCERAQP